MRHATELYHLTAAERRQMIEELSVVPRLAEDPNPRWPVWSLPHEPRRLSAEATRERVAAIRSALAQLSG